MDLRAIIVLGMHRSGTSALAGALASAGFQLPRRLRGSAPSNPKGHFEPDEIVNIHDRLLAALGTNWYGLEELPASRFASAEASGFAGELVSAIAADYPGSMPFIMKDPRVCRLMPLWRGVLSQCHAKPLFVLPVRNPLDVAISPSTGQFATRTCLFVVAETCARRGVPDQRTAARFYPLP